MATTLKISPRSLVRAVLIAGAALVLVVVASRATSILWWFVQASVFAALGYPLVERLGRHMPKFVAVLVLTGLVAGAISLLAGVTLTEVQSESMRFERAVPTAIERLESTDGIGTIIKDLSVRDQSERFATDLADRVRFQGADLPGIATKVGGSASAVFVVWILTVMLVFTGPSMVTSILKLAPDSARQQVDWVIRQAYRRSAGYLGLMAIKSVVVLVVASGVAAALDLDMPGLLGLIAAFLAFVPYVGILVGGLPIALMSLINGTRESIVVLAVLLVLQVADALVVQRRIEARTLTLGLFPTLVAAIIGYSFRGPGGLLTAVAIAALIVAVINDTGAIRVLRAAAHANDAPGSGGPVPDATTPGDEIAGTAPTASPA